MKFFAWIDDQQEGPFEEEALRKMLFDKRISQDTLLCSENGDLDWAPIKELFFQDAPPESFISPPPINELVEQSDDGARLEIRLHSGAELAIKAVRLYNDNELANVNTKKAEAMKMLKGVSTGLGAWGSLDWVLAASAAVGVVESILSATASSTGVSLLQEAIQAEQKLRKEGVFFPVSKIQYIENPIPGLWRALATKNIQVRTQVLKSLTVQVRHKEEIQIKKASLAFVHNGDEFISVLAGDNSPCSIRWSAVEHYLLSKVTP